MLFAQMSPEVSNTGAQAHLCWYPDDVVPVVGEWKYGPEKAWRGVICAFVAVWALEQHWAGLTTCNPCNQLVLLDVKEELQLEELSRNG